ncbi:cell filamentation protein Fic [Niveispirillum lacus]|uniref:Cell filamentation protein Fic n=2 Tax=Niveispirillum lacus TaxID=1981099 RepID=A0A255Z217_9PROT|nr:cell filamentation protein Fic [Niveispirillum lacus]
MNREALCHAVRQTLVRLPAPYESHYGIVPLPPPEEPIAIGDGRAVMEEAIAALREVETLAREISDPWIISRIIARQEALSSSAIEGTNSTLDEVLSVEEAADDIARNDARQVRSYALALDRLVPEARAVGHNIFSLDLIRQLHREVMRDNPDYQDNPGEWRAQVVWIGGRSIEHSTLNPPPPDRVEGCLLHTVDYLRNQGMQAQTQNLLTRMAVAHAHFEAVHPFRDGNGRVGRLLLPLIMAADGRVPLYLSPYIEARKDRYYANLKAAQQQLNWGAAAGFMAEAVVATVQELNATRQALRHLRMLWLERRKLRGGSSALRTLNVLSDYPVLTVNRLASWLDITFPAAAKAVDTLVSMGVLTERTGHRRNRLFAATEVLSILNRPFGTEPALPDR